MQQKKYLTSEEYQSLDATLAGRDQEPHTHPSGPPRTISKEDILRRIEEDRERHKKLRESIWVVPSDPKDWEFKEAWEQTSDLCQDDFDMIREDLALRTASLSQS